MSRSKQKGTAAETAVVNALQRLGWPHAERRALAGNLDKGDISGVPGVCFEVKDAKTWQASAWLQEALDERVNAKADHGILVIKLPGVGHANAEKWLTVMDDSHAFSLYNQANLHAPERHPFPFTQQIPIRVSTVGAVGLLKGVTELKERERHCGDTLVSVRVKRRLTPGRAHDPVSGYYNLMRFDARCRLLTYAGYGGYAIMDATTSNIVKENVDD